MVNSSSPRPRLKIVKACVAARVPINVLYSRHIAPHARLKNVAHLTLIQATLNLILPIFGVFILYRTNLLGAT